MKLLKTIKDTDLGLGFSDAAIKEERGAARAIVFDKDGKVALLHATKKRYHKLPGGGIEENEDIEMALRREVLEEIGCSIENIRELGIIEEYRNRFALHQISYCYLADVAGEKREPQLEEGELADGFEPEWTSLENAIKILVNEKDVEDYEGKFIQLRDLTFLKKAKNKELPKIIEDVGFDFHWDSKKVWALDEPITEMDINELIWHFEIPFWEMKDTDDYNLTPQEVIKDPDKHSIHFEKIQNSDLKYPIDIMENKGRWLILDGLHRLVKAHLEGQKKVKVRIIPRTRIPEILSDGGK